MEITEIVKKIRKSHSLLQNLMINKETKQFQSYDKSFTLQNTKDKSSSSCCLSDYSNAEIDNLSSNFINLSDKLHIAAIKGSSLN